MVAFRAIPAEGRGRPTPARGRRLPGLRRKMRSSYFVDSVAAADEAAFARCTCGSGGITGQSPGKKWGDFEGDQDCVVCAAAACGRLRGRSAPLDSVELQKHLESRSGAESRVVVAVQEKRSACRRSGAKSRHRRALAGRPASESTERQCDRLLLSLDTDSFSSGIHVNKTCFSAANAHWQKVQCSDRRVDGHRREVDSWKPVHRADQRHPGVLSRTSRVRALDSSVLPSFVGLGDYRATGCGIAGILRLGHSPTACTGHFYNSNGWRNRRCFFRLG